ncbi:MAG: hypothetical protein ED557_01965 [Balneola sp.]|nr:MAG: hypothetical protein ED557_01965 [Balneola sp.]
MRITLITFLLSGILLATHEGEYWPFSIYPMFSKAGNPWTRAIVTDVSNVDSSDVWQTTSLNEINGTVESILDAGVDQIDFSNFVSKTKNWDEKRVQALRTMLGEQHFQNEDWMIFKVRGQMVGDDSVTVQVTPYLLFKSDTTLFNPNLSNEDYFSE